MTLFVYGELCKPAVVREQVGRLPPSRVALLLDYRRRRSDAGWYEVVPASGALTAGLLLEGLDDRELGRLDRFESLSGGLYRRTTVRVRTLGAAPEHRSVQAYVAGEAGTS